MKRNRWILTLAAAFSVSATASAQTTLIESWENPANPSDGWTVAQPAFTSLGSSSTLGVTNGSYAWIVGPSATNTGQGPDYSNMLASPSTMAITTALANNNTLSIDVYTPAGSFGYQQWDLAINNTDLGYVSVDGYNYHESPSIGNETTLTWTLPSSITSILATSTNTTSINFQIGGGYTANNETMYVDNVVASFVAPPVTLSDVIASWVTNGGGAWENAANWSSNPSIPGAIGSRETFGAISSSSQPVVTLGQAANATLLDFQSPDGTSIGGYTINNSGSGSITVSAQIEADSGSHTINVPVVFAEAGSAGNGGPIVVDPGASLTIPRVSNSGQYGTFYLTADDGVSNGGTFSEGGMMFCSLDIAGTWNFLSSMITSTNTSSSQEFFSVNIEPGSVMNVNTYIINANQLSGSGTVNIGAGGVLTLGYYNSSTFYNGSFTGSGSLVFTGAVTNTPGQGAASQFLYNSSPAFSGPITVNFGDTLGVQSNNVLGNGSATNTLTLDNGILQAIGSFVSPSNVIITANGGTIDTDGPAGGTGAIIPGGTAITLGSVSSTANGTLTKINPGQLTVSKITGVSLTINGGTVQLAHNGTAAAKSSLNALTLATSGGVPQGSLDITNNAVSISKTGTPTATILSYLLTGYDNGKWDGAGIQSSAVASQPGTGIGYADGDVDSGTAATAGTVLVMDTWLGDLTLSGAVTSADLTTLTSNLGKTGMDWAHGDLNYDGAVNADDVGLFMLGSADYKAGGSQPVPEPATVGLLATSAVVLLRRRRR